MEGRKARVLAEFVQEMYVILFGIGLGNMLFLEKVDISEPLGMSYAFSAIFTISIAIKYWLDWATYLSGEVRSTGNEFIINFAILVNLLLFFVYFKNPIILAGLFIGLGFLDLIWVLNYLHENTVVLRLSRKANVKWILEKVFAIIVYLLVLILLFYFEIPKYLMTVILIIGFIIVRNISFRTVKQTRGLKFRKAKIEDANSIVDIHNQNARKNIKSNGQGFLLEETSDERLIKKFNDNATQYFVSTIKNKVVGFLQISIGIPSDELEEFENTIFYSEEDKQLIDNRHIHILTVGVSRGYKKTGVGKFIYQSLFRRFRGYSFSAYVVEKPIKNNASKVFHEKLGFEIMGRFISDFYYSLEDYRSILYLKRKD